MRLTFLFVLTLLCTPAYGQLSVGVAPISIPAWGKAENIHMIEASYSYFGLHYFVTRQSVQEPVEIPYKPTYRTSIDHNAALSFRYPIARFFRLGLISFVDKFPEPNASRVNLWMDIGVDIWRLRISYAHISNAFMAPVNTGYDSISISIRL